MANEGVTKFLESGGEDDSGLNITAPEPKTEAAPEQTPEPKVEPTEPAPKVEAPQLTDEQKAALKADREKRRKDAIEELGLVPHEALAEARSEAKTLKQQQAELLAWKQQIEPLLNQLKPKEGNPYDPNTQPQEYSAYEWQALQNEVKTLKDGQQQFKQQQDAAERTQQVMNWGQNQEREFIAKQADYADAAKFARESRARQLAVFNNDPAWIEATINNEIAAIIYDSAQKTLQGIPTNPAERAYQFAIANGYKPVDKTPPENDATDKIQAGLKASGGLKGGSTPKAKYSMEDLAAMPTKTPKQKAEWRKAWEEVYGRAP